jgi:ATP-dependent exoDNAse (exonuclease V) beta subunit
LPTDEALLAAAGKIRANLPAETWHDLDGLKANFRAWLETSEVKSVLQRSAYAEPQKPAFPTKLKPFWSKTIAPRHVEQERRFLVSDGGQFWNGSFDRVVWLVEGERTVAAEVIDFKTDAIPAGNPLALAERAEFYRPQLEAYRRAAARLSGLPEERIATRLVFTFAGRVIEI